ncbi:ISL3 family transposase [Streptomyces sp. NPDC002580]|uniref:ISL3 family transposase n=1 Tax=Streptomyces sp. NPDC002580 TaxID=3364653 RepID=UPI0036BBF24E
MSATLSVRSSAPAAACSGCGARSARVHGRYRRSLADLPVAGRGVKVVVTVRRFKCVNDACCQTTFSEQVPGLTSPFARRAPTLTKALVSIALALAGRAGSRLATRLGMPCGRDLLIKLIRAQPAPEVPKVTVLGVDDFAIWRRHSYNTILIDMETHRPIDVLPDREAQTLADWLAAHPGVEIVCRDRGGAYAEGVRAGAPQAMQVADGWHLWRNLAEAVEKTVGAHHGCIRAAFAIPPVAKEPVAGDLVTKEPPTVETAPFVPLDGTLDSLGRPWRLVTRTIERYEIVQHRLAEGKTLAAIRRELRLDHSTVRRFARARSLDELLVKATNRATILDEYKAYLHQRWTDGCHNIPQLHRELREQGFTGDIQCVRRYFRPFKKPHSPLPKQPPVPAPEPRPAPKPRRVVRWIMTNPAHLTETDATELKEIRAACPELDAAARHVRDFADMMRDLRGELLPSWMERVLAEDLPALHSLVNGLRRDHDAVTAALTTSWSSGQIEGHVTRVKLLKRMGFGRANLGLLRQRVLHSP